MPKVRLTDALIRSLRVEERTDFWDTNFPIGSFGIRVNPGGRKAFMLMYRAGGKLRRLTLGVYPIMGLALARSEALKAISQVADGRDPRQEELSRETFGWLAEQFMERYCSRLRQTTYYAYRRVLDTDLLPAWQHQPFLEIRRSSIIELVDFIAYKRNAPIQANRVRDRLNCIFNFAIKKGLVPEGWPNPCTHVEKPRIERRRDRVLKHEEISRLWVGLADDTTEPGASVYRLLLLTGQRSGEVRQMRWDQIDEEGVWTIPAEVAKNGKEHKVPLSKEALTVIEQQEQICEWVFPSRRDVDKPFLRSGVMEATTRMQPVVGAHFCAHDLRRTCATNLSQLGVDDVTIARILNHSWADRNVTSIYNRWGKLPEMRLALERWGSRLEQIVSGAPAKVVNFR